MEKWEYVERKALGGKQVLSKTGRNKIGKYRRIGRLSKKRSPESHRWSGFRQGMARQMLEIWPEHYEEIVI